MYRKLLTFTGIIFGIYLIYIVVTGVVIFNFQQPPTTTDERTSSRFYKEEVSSDRVAIVQDRLESGLARINLIENATDTLDISYYSIHDGISSDIFFGTLIEAADRGVHIRIILDGMVNLHRKNLKETIYVVTAHPNIELKYYEPFDPLRPWTWNNRFHDKLMIVDNDLAMVGGRNIGDKYFGPSGFDGASNDRDVLIINTDDTNQENSVIYDIKDYYNYVWEHEFTEKPASELSARQENTASEKETQLRMQLEENKSIYPDFFQIDINWLEYSFETNQVTFIHNPIERWNADPLIWKDLLLLMENAQDSIYVESPYIIPTDRMMEYAEVDNIDELNISFHTNSLASTPNLLAFSGYSNYRDKLAASDIELYEFQSASESLHGKTMIVDQRISAIGSFNFDPRSAFLNTEVMVVIDSEDFSSHLRTKFFNFMESNSLQVGIEGEYKDSNKVAEEDVSTIKKIIIDLLSWFTRFVEFLL
ncbi:phospholipase D-like domain-containing protein [Virgibacillus kimchii]